MKYLLAVLFIVFSTLTGSSQNIKRKGGLGVAFYQNVPDTLAKRLDYK